MLKRFLDVTFSIVVLFFLSPIIICLSILILFKLGSPVLFVQERAGKDGKIFKMFKFRTMTDARDTMGRLLPNKDRTTSFGNKLRSTSMDELPGLINVLKGDMSLVGPRPLLVEYLPLYNKEQSKRHQVRPGITGWAQVNGRNAISWEEKFKLDVWYVNKQSLSLDMQILLMTVKKVFIKEGVNASSEVTMNKFTGSK